MSELISKQFHNFVFNQGDIGGTKDVIADLNGVVSCNDIALSTVLDSGVGEKYFYESMKLAENVIISFEKEQPKLNENQEEYLEWLKKEWIQGYKYLNQFMAITSKKSSFYVVARLNNKELSEVYTEFFGWALDQC